MGFLTWLIAGTGLVGFYYLLKWAEWEEFERGLWDAELEKFAGEVQAEAWIEAGVSTLVMTSPTVRAIADVVKSFNDFVDDIFKEENRDYGLAQEWYTHDDVTGMFKLLDVNFKLPNGVVLKIISGEDIMNFRLDLSFTGWKGMHFFLMGRVQAMRLTVDPQFEWNVPGSEDVVWFVDPADPTGNTISLGKDCTPIQYIKDTDVEYIISCFLIFSWICEILYKLGFFKNLKTFYAKYMQKKAFTRVRDEINENQAEIQELRADIENITGTLSELQGDWYTVLSDEDKSKMADLFRQIKKLGWRPYG